MEKASETENEARMYLCKYFINKVFYDFLKNDFEELKKRLYSTKKEVDFVKNIKKYLEIRLKSKNYFKIRCK